MKTKSLLLASLMMFFVSGSASAQVIFQKTYGGSQGDYCYSVKQTFDGGYILAGYTLSYGAGMKDVYLIKTDFLGDTLWTKAYGGIKDDIANSVQQTSDSGFIIIGTTSSFGAGHEDIYVIKTNTKGDTLWTKTYGGYWDDSGYSILQTPDGGYLIQGTTGDSFIYGYHAFIIKADTLGNPIWSKIYGYNDGSMGNCLQQTFDGGYIIGGSCPGYLSEDILLIKTNSYGDTIWWKSYGGPDEDFGYTAQQCFDGSYILIGTTMSYSTNIQHVYMIKTDTIGNILWSETIGGEYQSKCGTVRQTADGGYIVVGSTQVGVTDYNVFLSKINPNSTTKWTKFFGASNRDYGLSVEQTNDGGFIIVGFTNSFGAGDNDIYLIKTDSNGNGVCQQGGILNFIGNITSDTTIKDIITMPSVTVKPTSSTISSGGIVTHLCLDEGISNKNIEASLSIFPNPTNITTTFTLQLPPNFTPATLQIFNALGAMVYEQSINQASTLINLNKPAGIYLVKVNDGDKVLMGKLVVE